MRYCQGFALATLFLCLGVGTSFAAGYVGIFTDESATSCEFVDTGGGALVRGYVVHAPWYGESVYGIRFSIHAPASWTPLSFVSPFQTVGAMQTDIAVSYGQCSSGKVQVGSALWFSQTAAETCSALALDPPALYSAIIVTNCEFSEYAGSGITARVNANPGCCCTCYSTEQSTWGSVKALYR